MDLRYQRYPNELELICNFYIMLQGIALPFNQITNFIIKEREQYLLLKYFMEFSNNNGSALLLTWVNKQRNFLGCNNTLYDFQHLKNTSFAYELFQNINQHYFAALNHLNFDVTTYLPALEEYLIQVEGKKLSRCYKKQILDQQSIEEIIKIAILLLLQSNQKGDFIARIVQMNVQVQTYLMVEIKRIQQNIENFIEIKDILSTVQKLEEENESLKQKIKSYGEINQQLSQMVTESRQQNIKIQKQINKYQNQKKQIFEELEIIDLKQYTDLYKCIKTENQELNYCLQDLQDKKRQTEVQNKMLKEKIIQDCQIISTLNDQIVCIRNNYSIMKQQMSTLSFSYHNSTQNSQDNALRQNKNFGNVKIKQSLETSCFDKSSIFLNHLQQDYDTQNQRIRNYNHEIMYKLQTAYKTITDLTNQITNLKDDKIKLQKKNNFLEKKMGDLKKQQTRFMKELRGMGF